MQIIPGIYLEFFTGEEGDLGVELLVGGVYEKSKSMGITPIYRTMTEERKTSHLSTRGDQNKLCGKGLIGEWSSTT